MPRVSSIRGQPWRTARRFAEENLVVEGKDRAGLALHHAWVAESPRISDGPPVPDAGRGRSDGVVLPAACPGRKDDPVEITLRPGQYVARLDRTRMCAARRVTPEPDNPWPGLWDRCPDDGQCELLRSVEHRARVGRPRRTRRWRKRPWRKRPWRRILRRSRGRPGRTHLRRTHLRRSRTRGRRWRRPEMAGLGPLRVPRRPW
jgi:hypothetical protein